MYNIINLNINSMKIFYKKKQSKIKREPSLQLKKIMDDIDDIIKNRIDSIDVKLLKWK